MTSPGQGGMVAGTPATSPASHRSLGTAASLLATLLCPRHDAATIRPRHDVPPPPGWPEDVAFLVRPRLAPGFPPELVPLLLAASPSSSPASSFASSFSSSASASSSPRYAPRPTPHPATVAIKRVSTPAHPAHGQRCLVARKRIAPGELVIPYLGVVHADVEGRPSPHAESDYDLSLLRLSGADPRNPFPGLHVSLGVDAAGAGNAARFVNDYRGVAARPNAEFRVGRGDAGELRMEVWALKAGIAKGDEVLVSYGKGWWGARVG
ncbi:hypothetical protein Q8F55_009188 [Vanrija albida]|uniref:SET domain-containing protein n=1 Tax=Vanrija albida TaxID=181172 RepID=A0ABR3PSX3_9TREE